MNELDIDNKGNFVIHKKHNNSGISFLLEDFFDKSPDKLKNDIELCQDKNKKLILKQFLNRFADGELDFFSNSWQEYEPLADIVPPPPFSFGFDKDGFSEFTSKNVIAIHSGFWYAADNLANEIKNIERYKNNYEGYKIAVDKIDIVIPLIKKAADFESALKDLQTLGLSKSQAEAFMYLNLNIYAEYSTDYLQERISICDRLTKILKEIQRVSLCTKLQESPMFQLSLSSKELFHSNFLYWIWQISPSMFQYVITQLFMKANRPIDCGEWPVCFEVKREYNNFDLCVISKQEMSNNQGYVWLVIENKVKSIPRLSQLQEYICKSDKNSENSKHLLLSLSTSFPKKKQIEKDWAITNYGILSDILKDCISESKFVINNYQSAIISDYADFIANLHKLQESWQIKTDETFIPKINFYGLRINDLYDKYRFSKLYTLLIERFEKIKDKLNIRIIEDSSRKEIFTGGHVPQAQNIFIGWGMTRAQGLLEVKILVEENVVLLVQIQGNQYRHCVELRNRRSAEENWEIYSTKNVHTAWFISSDNSNAPFLAFKDSPVPLDIRPDTTRHDKLYNQYGNEFLYKSITIPDKTTVEEVINMLINDCENILNHINQKS